MWNLRLLIVVTLLIALPFFAFAHHGSSGQFDTSTTFEVSGQVTDVRLVNPHAYVYFDVTNSAGELTNMRCELQSGSLLKRRGWTTDMFKEGTKIKILGSPDRTDPTTCYMNQITFENGITASRNSIFNDDGTLASSSTNLAQESALAHRPIKRADGTPNLDGNWAMVREKGAPPGAGGGSPIVLTAAGKAAVEGANSEQNPRFQCKATNIIMDWWFDQMVNTIHQTDSSIELTYGFMNLKRTIYLDDTQMPKDFVPNRAGFSTGQWQGETLVVTTTGFDEGWIMAPLGGERGGMPRGRPDFPSRGDATKEVGKRPPKPPGGGGPPSPAKNSPELTIIEYFSLSEDGTQLTREYTLTDPVNLEKPMTGSDKVMLTDDAYEPYDCDDLTTERKNVSNTQNLNASISLKKPSPLDNAIMQPLHWLEDSPLGLTISSTQWGYPIALSLHAIGMATLVGIALMLSVKVLGFASAIPVTAMTAYWRVAQAGFVINLLSGAALFCGNASELYFNWAFRIKLGLVFLGLFITWWMYNTSIKRSNTIIKPQIKLATFVLAVWVAAIIAGRLIGYMS
ncbi:DUF6152 family protein [Aliiglaciecola sp. 3_MG-2023]|uniref:DUF6152 family protein n=1 Tax=Aliiglaciecola sp. 3_MG-2023 TaxID=3062644 RepID=UPI0026E43B4A|nr:DUF6152 family protein [Aliiglaciecola sp. 3_MG-2023]MDO6694958.1 DUF6152 family protein [Aliiglaciecola sp. 3_MG-2023]